MRTAIPAIPDHADDLQERLQRERNGHKRPRLQMLYLLASGQAHTRQQLARLLGVHRNTIGRWLALYTAGGLEALLHTYVPAGKRVSLAPQVLASPEQARRQSVRRTRGVANMANASFTYSGSYADSRITGQLISSPLPRGFEHRQPSAETVHMEGSCHVCKHLGTSRLNSPLM